MKERKKCSSGTSALRFDCLVPMDWLHPKVMGDVKLQVNEVNVGKATEILKKRSCGKYDKQKMTNLIALL